MISFKTALYSIFIFLATLTLAACGGSSSDDTTIKVTTNEPTIDTTTDRPIFNRALASRAPSFTPSGNITDTTPSFTWTATNDASKYMIGHEDTDSTINWTQYTISSTEALCSTSCEFTPNDFTFTIGDEKVWWVRANVNEVWQNWSKGHIFEITEVTNNNDSIPNPISPQGNISDFTPEFSWTSVSNATNYQFGYENPDGASDWQEHTPFPDEIFCSNTSNICSFTPQFPNLFSGDNKRWWVRATINNIWGEWSEPKDFSLPTSEVTERPFILKVKGYRENQSSESVTNFVVGTNPNYTYKYNVDCNSDGILEATDVTTNYVCEYPDEYPSFSEYSVSISGKFPALFQREINSTRLITPKMIIGIEQWGTQVWQSMDRAFARSNLSYINQIDLPNLSQVSSMNKMFSSSKFPLDANSGANTLADWDVSNVTSMQSMFRFSKYANPDISNWDVSNVKFTDDMFSQAESFNQDLSNWNVSNVTSMRGMFSVAKKFNADIGSWDVSKVTNMSNMFTLSERFNQDISNWNVSNVTSMPGMFASAKNFNQDIGNWDVSKVTTMAQMFRSTSRFNQNIGSWDVGNVTEMDGMFSFSESFNQNIETWDVGNVTEMNDMFRNAQAFDQDIGNWDISNVTRIESMFKDTALSFDNYDSTLIGWSSLALKPNLSFDAGNSKYSSNAINARNKIINQFGWTITDGGLL